MELNRIKVLLRDLALSHGLTDADLNSYNVEMDDNEWHIDWKRNLDESFDKRIKSIEAAINLYDLAMRSEDRLTAKAGLIHAGIALQDLSNFFDGLMHDVKKAYGDPRFGWPKFPSDDWKIPPEYGFKE
ncbi:MULTISPECIES: hypothetical protein [Burkholderia]|uniref:Uncharacterized protein n=1 Tax=Burkholderia vietnamiensis TaxID=60552 RepID=A0AAW7T9C4_BURVI|nr:MULTISPECIES: hypothetical protein [Burkholderia]MBH9648133.1 hypothetical protein [Burkholderia vietnamiensis]MBR8000337.1 hypothetical protein [Burkholderia vietnamiensis]MBR8010462.1 hypothetical protein [Burkholderia vietnamiensis]MBR8052534.1 hypothetical protein [Burkholderia vietnamiensis]MBR8228516.1 hypothetical protein [Burkholderia vietnamiensis]